MEVNSERLSQVLSLYDGATADKKMKFLQAKYSNGTGTIEDREYKILGALGYEGSLRDRWNQYLQSLGGSLADNRDIVYKTFYGEDTHVYNDFVPDTVLDFENVYATSNHENSLFSRTKLPDVFYHRMESPRTMVDSDGYIKFGPHNLIKASENFAALDDGTIWGGASATTKEDYATTAPDGSKTASKLAVNNEGTYRDTNQTVNAHAGQRYEAGVWLKKDTYRYASVQLQERTSGGGFLTTYISQAIDLETGTAIVGSANYDSTITAYDDGWYKIHLKRDADISGSSTQRLYFYIFFVGSDGAGNPSPNISSGSSIFAWGAYLHRTDLGGMVDVPKDYRSIDTETRYVSSSPRKRGKELVKGGNPVGDITTSTSPWFHVETTSGWNVNSNGDLEYDGSAWSSIRQDVGTLKDRHYEVTFEVTGRTTGSLHVYQDTGTQIKAISANGKFAMVYTPASNTKGNAAKIQLSGNNGFDGIVKNFSIKEVPFSYNEPRCIPRIGHHIYNGGNYVNEGVLIESAVATNKITYSIPTDAQWGKTRATITDAATTSPSGKTDAVKLNETTDNGSHYIKPSNLTVSSDDTATYSVFLKAGTRNFGGVWFGGAGQTHQQKVLVNLTTGEYVTTTGNAEPDHVAVENFGNGWWRVSMTATAYAGSFAPIVIINNSLSASTGYAGATDKHIFVWGAHLEFNNHSVNSSFIPTYKQGVSASPDVALVRYENLPWPSPVEIGDELVTNGDFDTNTTGWSLNYSGTPLSVVNGVLRVTEDGVDGSSARAYQAITCEIGKVYQASVYMPTSSQSNGRLAIGLTGGAYGGRPIADVTSGNTTVVYFVADATTLYVQLVNSGTTADYADFDNISVKEINPRSVSFMQKGKFSFADEDLDTNSKLLQWGTTTNEERILVALDLNETNVTGQLKVKQVQSNVYDQRGTSSDYYEEGVNIPYAFCVTSSDNDLKLSLHGEDIDGSDDLGISRLPKLEEEDLAVGSLYFNGTIKRLEVWGKDIKEAGRNEASEDNLYRTIDLTFDSSNNSYVVPKWSKERDA